MNNRQTMPIIITHNIEGENTRRKRGMEGFGAVCTCVCVCVWGLLKPF